jgi:hypothetical protein
LHEAAKMGNFNIIHFMLTDTGIDPNLVGRGEINLKKEETKTDEFDNGNIFGLFFNRIMDTPSNSMLSWIL